MGTPEFKLLQNDAVKRARLVIIRHAVTDLLGTNYLSHFTDHSVHHSDQLCVLVDDLASSLDQTKRLSPLEAAVLYAACYFHDAGMQHQQAGETETVKKILKLQPYWGQQWSSLELKTQQEIVRRQHHMISEELVRNADCNGDPALGITLTDDDKVGVIAALCKAHCLSIDTDEYRSATADQGGLRVGLLSALLRLADILDESRRRSRLFLELTRKLPLKSRLEWWRHYYVSNVTIDARVVTIWFDFPSDRRAQYKELFEPLQMPWIEAEFKSHSNVLALNGLAWHLQARDTPEMQCMARVMDDELERYAVEKAVKRRSDKLREMRIATVRQLRIAQPTVERQFAALRTSTASDDEQLTKAVELAEHLAEIGGRRDGWMSLQGEFNRLKARTSESICMNVALRLGEMMVEDNASDTARRHLQEFRPQFLKLIDGDRIKLRFLRIWAEVLRDYCAYPDAVSTFDELARTTNNQTERAEAMAEIDEMHLLQGELEKLCVDGNPSC
jgi:hypothetical protein